MTLSVPGVTITPQPCPKSDRLLTRTRSGRIHPQVLPRDQRRQPVINEALRQMFLLGVSPPARPGAPVPTLVEDAVSAATVSAVSQVMDTAVHGFDRRRRADHYRDLILDGASVRLRLVGQVQRRIGSVRLRPPRRATRN